MNTTSDRRRESTPLLDALLASPVGEHRNQHKNDPFARLTLGEVLDRIQRGHYAQMLQPVQSVREMHGYPSPQYSKAKEVLPVFTFTGICHRKLGNSYVIESSGVLILDVDKLPTTDVAVALRDAALQISHTVAAFLSPSKHGFKVIVALDGTPPPGNETVHKVAYRAAKVFYETALSIKIDGSGSDSTHFCYVSHDPDMGWGQGVPLPWQVSDTAADADMSQDHDGRNRRPRPREKVDDHAAIEEALRHIPCPRETGNGDGYNAWLDLIIMQKAVGRTPEQVAQWCEGGKAGSCGDNDQILSRWDGLRDDAPGLACARIKKLAREQGWKGPQNAGFSGHGGNGHRGNGRNSQGFRSGFNFSGPRQDPPDTILPKVKPQRPYPAPAEMARHHAGILETSGASAAAAGTAMLASMALLASEDFDVAWPPGGSTPTPLGLFILHLSESGGRKSSVWTRSFAGHVEADRRIEVLWKEAKSQWNEWEGQSKEDKKKASAQKPEMPTKYMPKAVRRDTTPQALIQRYSGGRRTQGLINGEAGSVVSTGAWAMGRENRVKTLSDLCEIYSTGAVDLDRVRDDLEVSLAGIRLTIAWAVQPAIGLPFITSSDSGNGFAARTLLSVDDRLPDYLGTRFEWEIGESARDVSAEWDRLIIKVRERQDSEYADEDCGRRTVIQIDPEAERAIVKAGAKAHDSAQKNKNLSSQEASFLVRVGEQIARVAGIIAAYRVYKKEDEQHPSPVIMPQDVTAAWELVQWHYEELLRQADVSRATEDAKAAQWVVGNLDRCVSDPRYQSAHDGAYRVNHWLGSAAAGPAKHVRSDPEAKARVMELLETHGYVEIVNRGAYRVNLNGKSGD